MKKFLHVGCGPAQKEHTTRTFASHDWQEIRFDIDARARPDIVGTMTDMAAVEDASVDAVFSAHNIEHLFPHEVPRALKEFLRVLKPDGFAVIACPDLQSVCALVSDGRLLEPAYISAAGPISPMDILYGLRPALASGNHYMAHKCGFTEKVLATELFTAGFASVAHMRRAAAFDLWVLGAKTQMTSDTLGELARSHFPVAA
ncbi:methyltransferase domain-containing protein [Rhodoblastus acidophilus]|jgi:SAM-dependent methyltransferase|uniref:Methyltransferase domain-containing protein n=1 Tax=Rhodoblastus acidophilus TaxID=1074 RepID=A0A6N8DPJ2_RHOAC|nr:class I SAM-dependent methyltransferase [Rhodoblastus acidophilus]MCW2274971.1 SAM-dependent methyltransferase [Rhodoblastus acidophilus]MTV31445.1 methyltransferase domain-containing protein [Rhodoblastus acidophilus]